MNYSSSDFKAAQRADFNHTCRLILVEWANHVIDLAPLPELKTSIELIKFVDEENGSERSRRYLRKHSDKYFRGKKRSHPYGYTALGQVFLGVGAAVRHTLNPRDSFNSGYGQRFTEACYLAAQESVFRRVPGADCFLPDIARKAEADWQHEVHKKHFDLYYKEFGWNWSVQKAKQEGQFREAA